MKRVRRRFGYDEDDAEATELPPLVRAALDNLRNVTAQKFQADAETESKIVDVLARAAAELKRI